MKHIKNNLARAAALASAAAAGVWMTHAVAQSAPEAKARVRDFLEKRAAKVARPD